MAVDILSNSRNHTQSTNLNEEYEKIIFIGTLGFQTSLFEDDLDKPIFKTKTIYVKKAKGERK